MIAVRKGAERGHFDFGWLNTYHTFSFSDYYDQRYVQFRSLRVINEDRVQPGEGFGTHPHRNMEIVTYVLEGALAHKDSMGNGSVIRPGDVQRMSAGTGITHSEFNHSQDELVHFLQIWLMPSEKNIEPGYEQKFYTPEQKREGFRLIASPDGQEESVLIHQDALIYATVLDQNEERAFKFQPERHGYLQVARGSIKFNDQVLEAGDGASLSDEQTLSLIGNSDGSEVILFDLA